MYVLGQPARSAAWVLGAAAVAVLVHAMWSRKLSLSFSVKKRRIVILFGPPGAGKGTQGVKLAEFLALPSLNTGDMIRDAVAAKTPIGKKVKALIKAGKPIGDKQVLAIFKERITADDCKNGFILDGFPKTMAQAKMLDQTLSAKGENVSDVLVLDSVPDSALEERIVGRWIHKKSGTSYHVTHAPPKSMKLDAAGKPVPGSMLDDATGEPLMQRPDDTAEKLVKRLQRYRSETAPIIEAVLASRYSSVVKKFDANAKPSEVWGNIREVL